MDRTVWILVGFHKTGTTFIQHALDTERAWLLERGFLFPRTGLQRSRFPQHRDAISGHRAPLSALERGDRDSIRQLARDLADEVRSAGSPHVVWGSESMSWPTNARYFSELIDHVASFGTPRVVAYLRRQDEWIDSFYRELLCWTASQETRCFDAFLAEDGPVLLDYRTRLDPFISGVGRENLVVRSYDDARAREGILTDLLQTIGIDETPPLADSRLRNPSLDPAHVNLVRAINGVPLVAPGLRSALQERILDMPPLSPRNASLLSDATWDDIARLCGPANRALAKELMSGPTQNFQFPAIRPAMTPVRHVLDERTAVALARTLVDAGITAERRRSRPLPGTFGVIATVGRTDTGISEFVRHHLATGAAHIALFFDNPDHPDLHRLAGTARVTCVPCTSRHWGRWIGNPPNTPGEAIVANLRAGDDILKSNRVEFAIGLGWGERLHASGTIADALAALPAPADLLHVLPAWPTDLAGTPHTRIIDGKAYTTGSPQDAPHPCGRTFWRTKSRIDVFDLAAPMASRHPLTRLTLETCHVLHADACISETASAEALRPAQPH